MIAMLRTVAYRVRAWFRRDAMGAELAEEMELHRALLMEDARREGVSDDEARRRAAVRFGNATVLREQSRDWWSLGWLEAMAQDLRYAVRFLRRSPGFTTVALLSLALGIGVNAAVFTVVDDLLLEAPPHVVAPEALYRVNVKREYRPGDERPFHDALTFPEAFALREQARTTAAVVVFTGPQRVRLGRGPDAPRVKEAIVSADFFEVLGVRPLLGRFFASDDLDPRALDRPAVVSHGFWQRQLGGTSEVIGHRFDASGVELTVIGVAPAGFRGLDLDAADYWVPLDVVAPLRIGPEWRTWRGYGARVAVRLREGVAPPTASAEATMLIQQTPNAEQAGALRANAVLGPVLAARGPAEQRAEVTVSTRLAVASLLVLVAACANLATLLLLRALTRRREIAVRMAVGISRRRLVGQLLLEALVLSLAGAGIAVVAARWGGSALRGLVFPDLTWASGPVELRVLLFALACAVVVALLAGLTPAIRLTRPDVAQALRSAAPQLAVSTGRLRQTLLVLQVALSVVMIVGAVVFVQSFHRARSFDVGYDLDRLVVARMGLESDTQSTAGRLVMLEEAVRRVSRLPGVERALVAPVIPLLGNTVTEAKLPGRPSAVPAERNFVVRYEVTPDLADALGLRLVAGRWFTSDESRDGLPVLLASQEMVRRLWPGENAIGQCVRLGADTAPCHEVVGIVRDVRQMRLVEPTAAVAFVATREAQIGEFHTGLVVVRTGRDAGEMAPAIRNVLLDLHPDLASISATPLAQQLEPAYRPLRLGAMMFGAFAVLAALLAGVGLYGILAFGVAQRLGEIGIRSALGASTRDIVQLVSGEAVVLVLIGLGIGGAVSWFAARTIDALLFEASARAVAPYVLASLLLVVVAACASALPVRRAARVNPVTALRAE